MDKFTVHQGVAAPMLQINIDTDAIIPSREMKLVGATPYPMVVSPALILYSIKRNIKTPVFYSLGTISVVARQESTRCGR